MKKTTQKTKTLVLTMAMAIGLLLPMTMRAQSGGSDNWFRGGGDNYENREGGLSNQTFGSETGGPQSPTDLVPIGSGLLIMFATGIGYAMLKKKED